ncbi:hypothetical protein TNCV_3051361 [Trichonephila clavipes]|nr:hypothetical protein TNCV_3051361 [Trichonephila clavipes]
MAIRLTMAIFELFSITAAFSNTLTTGNKTSILHKLKLYPFSSHVDFNDNEMVDKLAKKYNLKIFSSSTLSLQESYSMEKKSQSMERYLNGILSYTRPFKRRWLYESCLTSLVSGGLTTTAEYYHFSAALPPFQLLILIPSLDKYRTYNGIEESFSTYDTEG